jgi:hypothetical protein
MPTATNPTIINITCVPVPPYRYPIALPPPAPHEEEVPAGAMVTARRWLRAFWRHVGRAARFLDEILRMVR